MNKFADTAGVQKWLSIQYGVPYTDFFNFSKSFGQDWYSFGLNAGAGYQAIFKADALKAELQANSSARAGVSVTLFKTDFPVVDANLGAGNHLDLFDATNGFRDVPTGQEFKKWIPKINANVKIFGITVFSKTIPQNPSSASEEASLKNLQKAFEENSSKFEDKYDEFKEKLNANSTEIGSGGNGAASAGDTASPNPEQKSKISKSFFNFRRSAKDIFGTALIIPIVPPLNVEIDFGVYFSSSLDFQLGISGGGFSINASKNMLASTPGPGFLEQAKSGLMNNQFASLISSASNLDFSSGDLASLAFSDEGLDTLDQMIEAIQYSANLGKIITGKNGPLSKEVKASVKILPSMSAGGFASAAVVLDVAVASASAGIEGNLNLIQSRIGGGLDFSTASDYVDLAANGFMNLMSGTIDLFAKLSVDAVVYQNSWEWRKNLFSFPGITKEFNIPIARMAYRGGNASVNLPAIRAFFCIDQSFKPVPKYAFTGSTVNECDLSTRFVPDVGSDEMNRTVASLLLTHGINPAVATDPCVVAMNGRLIVATSSDTSTCASRLTSSDTIKLAYSRYPEKFISNLYDSQTGKPAIVLEAFVNQSSAASPVLNTSEVNKYDYNWKIYFDRAEAAAQASGRLANSEGIFQDTQSNDYIPPTEPTITLPFTPTTPSFTSSTVPVEQIGWLNDNDLMNAASAQKIGFCSVTQGPVTNDPNDPSRNCDYYVKAMGVTYPDGISCVSRNGTLISQQSGAMVEKSASQYDCSGSSTTNNSKQVASCLLRKAFQNNYCYPPAKANYIVRLYNYLASASEEDLIIHLWNIPKSSVASARGNMITPGTTPPYAMNTCRIGLWRDGYPGYRFKQLIYGNACSNGNNGCDVSCPSVAGANNFSNACTPGSCFAGVNKSAAKECYYINTSPLSSPPSSPNVVYENLTLYKGTCSAAIQPKAGGSWFYSPKVITCKDKNGTNTAGGASGTCDCTDMNITSTTRFSSTSSTTPSMIGDFRNALLTNKCAIDMSTNPTPVKEYQQAPGTCELIAQSPPNTGAPIVVPFPTGNNSFSNRAECKNMFSGAESSLCDKAKSKVPAGTTVAQISSRFRGSEIDEITTCRYESDGSTLTTTAGPALTSSAAAKEGCDVLLGNSPSNTILFKSYQGMSGNDIRCREVLPTELSRFCKNIDDPSLLKMKSQNYNMGAIKIYTRLNTTSATGATIAGSPVEEGSCDLTIPAPKLTRDGSGNLLGACELIATSQNGSKLIVDRKVTTTTSTPDSCFNSFQPYSLACENLPKNPIVKNEILAKPGSFVNNAQVPLMIRFTPASGPESTRVLTPACTFGPPLNTGKKCEILVKLQNGFLLKMDGSNQSTTEANVSVTYKTRSLVSYADVTSQDCSQRFLAGATLPTAIPALGTIPADVNKSSTCFGLSLQISRTTGSSTSTTSGESTASGSSNTSILKNQTVQMFTRFNNSTVQTYVGSCRYDANGQPVLNSINIQQTSAPTLGNSMGGTLTNTSNAFALPEIVDLYLNPTNSAQFFLKVRYTGQIPSPSKFNGFTVELPNMAQIPVDIRTGLLASSPAAVVGSGCSGSLSSGYVCRLPNPSEIMTVGPFATGLIADCFKLNLVKANLKVTYPSDIPSLSQIPFTSNYSKTLSGITQCSNPGYLASALPDITDFVITKTSFNNIIPMTNTSGTNLNLRGSLSSPPSDYRYTIHFPVLQDLPLSLRNKLIQAAAVYSNMTCTGSPGSSTYSCTFPAPKQSYSINNVPTGMLTDCNEPGLLKAEIRLSNPSATSGRLPTLKAFNKSVSGLTDCGCNAPYSLVAHPYTQLQNTAPSEYVRCLNLSGSSPLGTRYKCCAEYSASPSPTPRPSVAASPSPTPRPSVAASPSPTPRPSVAASPSPTPRPSVAASPSPTPRPSVAASPSPSPAVTYAFGCDVRSSTLAVLVNFVPLATVDACMADARFQKANICRNFGGKYSIKGYSNFSGYPNNNWGYSSFEESCPPLSSPTPVPSPTAVPVTKPVLSTQ